MSRLLAIIGHLFLILAGYVAASLAGSAFIHVLFFATAGFTPEQLPPVITGASIISIPLAALFVAYFAFMPSTVAILIAELFSLRSWLSYALAGGGVGAVIAGAMWQATRFPDVAEDLGAQPNIVSERPLVLAIVGAGIVAGIAYWAVAGRFAGVWKGEAVEARL